MKQRLVIFLVVLLNTALFAYSATLFGAKEKAKQSKSVIELQAALHSGTLRSCSILPIQARFDADELEVVYLNDFNGISVEITDESGKIVYMENPGNKISGSTTCINISNWDSGFYVIRFCNNYNELYYGDFDL